MKNRFHIPVMLDESINGLNINPLGVYVDVTYGGGGHSNQILSRINGGHLFSFDQDKMAISNKINNDSLTLINMNFKYLSQVLKSYGVDKIDGLIADLGVSSYQFDKPERGFSTRFNSKIDMRMNTDNPINAVNILNNYEKKDLQRIFKIYGDLRNSKNISEKICDYRIENPIKYVNQLKEILKNTYEQKKENKFLAKLFQAIRIEVNDEINSLKQMLKQSINLIKIGGRLVVISYHSLEDRLVKNIIKNGKFDGEVDKDFYGNSIPLFKKINKKPITPSNKELFNNSRSRSAKLRIAERI